MQLLYNQNRDPEISFSELKKKYWQQIDQSYKLLLLNVYLIREICRVALDDAEKRKSKFLPSDQDKIFKPILFTNPQIQSLVTNKGLNKTFKDNDFESHVDRDILVNIYNEYAKMDEYSSFLHGDHSSENVLDQLLSLYRFLRKNESFNEIVEDIYLTWEDDKSVVVGSVKKLIKSLPANSPEFFREYYPDDDTIKELGEQLLSKTFQEDKTLSDKVKEVSKNWDYERIAVIDLILIKMGLVEFLHFDTIPTNVTINEYIELSKLYSTPKSHEFVNGILEKISSDLKEEGLLS
jgi:transcription antitermination protein NusB